LVTARPDFYLASSEGYGMQNPRRAFRLKRIGGDHRDDYLLIRIDPPLIGQTYGLGGEDVYEVIVATRSLSESLFPIERWPAFVHVALPLVKDPSSREVIHDTELREIAWAELYRNEEDASAKAM